MLVSCKRCTNLMVECKKCLCFSNFILIEYYLANLKKKVIVYILSFQYKSWYLIKFIKCCGLCYFNTLKEYENDLRNNGKK